jgi:hypothetical protein
VKKHNFDQTPKLLETFDQLIWSSEIRSSDHFPDLKETKKFSSHILTHHS